MGLVCTRQAHVLTIHPNEPEPRLEQVPTTPENLTTEMQQTLSLIPGDGLKVLIILIFFTCSSFVYT